MANKVEYKATRDGYGEQLVELGKQDENIVVLDADLSKSTRTDWFAQHFPNRFFNIGIAESNMMGIAAGLAVSGKTVFVSTFAIFATARPWEIIRNTIAYNDLNVKIVASHGGISVGADGGSHQAIEDIGIMRQLPNMRVIVPADFYETKKAVEYAYKHKGCFYIRTGRAKSPVIFDESTSFQLGKGNILIEGDKATIIANGWMVQKALQAADLLKEKGINVRVVNMSSVKPIDKELIIDCIEHTYNIITIEEHLINNGLGSAVAEVIAEYGKGKLLRMGIKDRFGISGEPEELFEYFELNPKHIVNNVLSLI